MQPVELKKGIYWVGALDWNMRSFHGHTYTTKRGTTYNAYLIVDQRSINPELRLRNDLRAVAQWLVADSRGTGRCQRDTSNRNWWTYSGPQFRKRFDIQKHQ